MWSAPKAICISFGPARTTTTAVSAVKARMPASTIRTERWNWCSESGSSLLWSAVRWGRIEVETAWKSCSGARAIISTLKMNPVAAEPLTIPITSGPALRKTCSLNMIRKIEPTKPAPWASENSSRASSSSAARSSWPSPWAAA